MTFASLPQEAKDQFERWKNQVIKDCAWEEAFPSLAREFPAPSGETYVPADSTVDMRALLASNGGSPLFTGPDGQLVLMGPALIDLGFATNERKYRDSNRVFEITSNRDTGTCVITLDGEELYRAEMPSRVGVYATVDREALTAAGNELPALVVTSPVGNDTVAMTDGGALLRKPLAAMTPNLRALGFFAERFDTTEAVLRNRFALATTARGPDVARFVDSAATPFAPGAAAYGPRAALEAVYAGAAVRLELLYRFAPQLIAIRVDLPLGTEVKTMTITAGPSVALSDQAAVACFVARGDARLFEVPQARRPAFSTQFDGCNALAADGYAALAGDATVRQSIAATAMLGGRPPEAPYRGWDAALIEIAKRLDAQGVALTELDPAGQITALPAVVGRRDTLLAAIDATARPAFAGSLLELSFGWHFRGIEPGAVQVTAIATALANAAAAYPDSTRLMIEELVQGVGATSPGMLAAQCGAELVGARAAQIRDTFAALRDVPFATGFAETRANAVLQDCPSSDALTRLATSAAAVRSFAIEDQARAGTSTLFEFAIEPLVIQALEQGWTSATFDAITDLVDFAVIGHATYCAPERSISERVDCIDFSLSFFTAEDGGVLAPGALDRYARLARDLAARWPSFAGAGFVATRFDVEQAFFRDGGMWSGCSNEGFARSATRLMSLLTALQAETDSFERFELEAQIDNLVDAATCP